ncbi:hypothetical protein [Ktedonospora formicarum]|uniref:Uncharacterized protein n=1 Tax=Ktedonospora formicarum TaxID=2778364 RepID=A0A8J3I350_9CHLR|nr:hypothetical protein [Ktedonospora formicarum]GHO48449.1 hypothetical protein KSX_66120 [Ktedonospora formicarum]
MLKPSDVRDDDRTREAAGEDAQTLRAESNQVLDSVPLRDAATYAEAAVRALASGNVRMARSALVERDKCLARISVNYLEGMAAQVQKALEDQPNPKAVPSFKRAADHYKRAANAAGRGERFKAAREALWGDLEFSGARRRNRRD